MAQDEARRFDVGDRVVCLRSYDNNDSIVEQVGTIVKITRSDRSCAVEFDRPIEHGHSCSGNGIDGHCWWVPQECLERYDDANVPERIDLSYGEALGI